MSEQFDHLFKILMVGNSGAGKSSILWRFTDDEFFDSTSTTIGVDFKIKLLELAGKRLKLSIWDTAGQERFRTLTSSYYRNAQAVILVYDVTNEKSFHDLKNWLQEIDSYSTYPKMIKLLVGNKIDLLDRQIPRKEAETWAREHGMLYLECSAKSSLGVKSAFEEVVEKILEVDELLDGTRPTRVGESISLAEYKDEDNPCFC